MPRDSTAATKIGSLRSTLGMVQEAFADEVGVAQGVVSAWERGEYAPSAENYVELTRLAEEHELYSQALWFLEQSGIGRTELLAIVKETHSRRDAAYRQAFSEAQAMYPNDEIAKHRFAMAAAARALRMRRRKK